MLNIVCRKVRLTFNTAHVPRPDTFVTGYWARVIGNLSFATIRVGQYQLLPVVEPFTFVRP